MTGAPRPVILSWGCASRPAACACPKSWRRSAYVGMPKEAEAKHERGECVAETMEHSRRQIRDDKTQPVLNERFLIILPDGGNATKCGMLRHFSYQALFPSRLSIHAFNDLPPCLARMASIRSVIRPNFAAISSNTSFWIIKTSIVDTRFYLQSKVVFSAMRWICSEVAACGALLSSSSTFRVIT